MYKKGQADTILNWLIYRLPILIFVSVFFALVLSSHYRIALNSHQIENVVLIKRLINNPEMLAYQDSGTGRVYPGIVDIRKFNTQHLEILEHSDRIAANLELLNLETNESLRAYVNENRARAWDDYVAIGGYDLSSLVRYVTIRDQEKAYPGILRIKVIFRE